MIDTPTLAEAQPRPTAVIRGASIPMAELGTFFDAGFRELPEAIDRQGAVITSAAFALYLSMPTDVVDVEIGFAVDRPIEPTGRVVPGMLPGGRLATAVYAGGYDGLGAAWGEFRTWLDEHELATDAVFWEIYVVEPTPTMDPADLRTELVVPVR